MLSFIAESPPSQVFDHEAWARTYNATQGKVAHYVNAEDLRRGDLIRPSKLYARRVLACEGDQVVGCGLTMNLAYAFDPQRLWVWVSVLPSHQGRGVGAAIFEEMMEAARGAVRPTQLMCRVSEEEAASLRFLGQRGFETRMKQVPSILDVKRADFSALPGLIERLGRDGVEVVSLAALRDRDPDWQQRYWSLNADIEARLPSPIPVTPIEFDLFVKTILESPWLCAEATHLAVAGDVYVGVSGIRTVPGVQAHRDTGLTGVRVGYQRRGIATALKLAVMKQTAAEGATEIYTENAATNPMLALNAALGFTQNPAICVMFCDLPSP